MLIKLFKKMFSVKDVKTVEEIKNQAIITGMNLNEICKSLLDNADMKMNFDAFPKVKLDIYIQGTLEEKFWKVVFECNQVTSINIELLDDDITAADLVMVLDTNIKEFLNKNKEKIWRIDIGSGEISLLIETKKFNWQLVELSEADYRKIYNYKL